MAWHRQALFLASDRWAKTDEADGPVAGRVLPSAHLYAAARWFCWLTIAACAKPRRSLRSRPRLPDVYCQRGLFGVIHIRIT